MSDSTHDELPRFPALSSTCVSDALDALSLQGVAAGISALCPISGPIAGPAITVRLIPAGSVKSFGHLAVTAIESAMPGDVLVIDNGGCRDAACFGGLLATAAKLKSVAAVVADGVCRDGDDYIRLGLPVFARGRTVLTARGRFVDSGRVEPIRCGGVQVRTGDIVVADLDGVAIVPVEHAQRVFRLAKAIADKEAFMKADLLNGHGIADIDAKYGYESMLASPAVPGEPES